MRRLTLTRIISTALVMVIGMLTLLGLVVGDDMGLLSSIVDIFAINSLAQIFVRVAVLIIAFSILAGIVNLLFVNARKFYRGRTLSNRVSGAVILVSFISSLALYIIGRATSDGASEFLLDSIQLTVESSLAGLLCFSLVYGAVTTLRDQVSVGRVLFVLTILVVLLGAIPLAGFELMSRFTDWLMFVPVSAGARGILLGVALATIVTGVRVLFGQDRSYGE